MVHNLIATIEEDVSREAWVTKRYPKKMRDNEGEIFEIPALFLQKGPARLLLDPIAYDLPGTDTALDLYLIPTYDDMASIYSENGDWSIHYTFSDHPEIPPIDKLADKIPLTDESILSVLNRIADHAVPSV